MIYKALIENKIVAINETGIFDLLIHDSVVEDTEHNVSDYEQLNGEFILKSDFPISEINEKIRKNRQTRYEEESDPLRLDYDEALARGSEDVEELKIKWLSSKDKIREELPYVQEKPVE